MHHPSGVPSGCLGCIKAKAKAKPSTSSTDERRRCMGTAMASGDGWTGLSLLGCLQGDETLVTKLLEKEALSHTLIVCKAYIIFIYLLWTQNDWSPRTSFPNSSTLLPSNHSPQVRHKKYFEGGGFDYKLMTCFWPTLEKFWKTHTHTKIKLKKKHIYCISTWCSSTSWFFGTLIFFKPKIIIASGKSPGWRPPRDSSRGGSVGYIFSPANLHRFFTPRHPPPCLRCVPQVTRGCFKVRIPEKTKAQKWNVQKIGELNKGS